MPKGYVKLADLQPKKPPRFRRAAPAKDGDHYRQVWRVVDGAIRDCFQHHPEFIHHNTEGTVRRSLTKRVVGSVMGYAAEVKRRGAGPS